MAITYRGLTADGDLTNTEMDSNFQTCENRWEGSSIASAASLSLTANYNYFTISGSTDITSISDVHVGHQITLKFDSDGGAIGDATNILIPGSLPTYTWKAGDVCTLVNEGSGVWRMTNYLPNLEWDTAITQSVGDNSEKKATTAYVLDQFFNEMGEWTQNATFNTTGVTLGETTTIPAGCTEILLSFIDVENSTAATILEVMLMVADTATYSNTTYSGVSSRLNSAEYNWDSSGVSVDRIDGDRAGDQPYGTVRLTKRDGENIWNVSGMIGTEFGVDYIQRCNGMITLAGEMDRLKIIALGGTGSFTGTVYVEVFVP